MPDPEEHGEARAYKVWRVDCDCGTVIDYGEDDSSYPEKCEECGLPVRDAERG